MTIELKRGAVYGPVASRRLGRSLGINLLPPRRKLCSFDCVYCQYGRTESRDVAGIENELPAVDVVLAAVEAALSRLDRPPEWLTFSGNGEPTLYPGFPEVVDGILELRDRVCPGTRTAVLSCSTEAARPEIRAALARLDARIMKLDVGSQALLDKYNRPAPGVTLDGIVAGLAGLEDVTLQALFAGGEDGNFTAANLKSWLNLVSRLRPREVQLYSLARSTAPADLRPLGRKELSAIAAMLDKEGIRATVY